VEADNGRQMGRGTYSAGGEAGLSHGGSSEGADEGH
jgi:hypothetical protein